MQGVSRSHVISMIALHEAVTYQILGSDLFDTIDLVVQ